MDGLSIGKLAAASGFGVETLRFYEREGLLPEPPRTASGYRVYPVDSVPRMRFVRRAKELGFSLQEIRELLRLQDGGGRRREVRELTAAHLAEVERRIADLQRVRDVLAGLRDCCDGRGAVQGCPIIEAIASEDALDRLIDRPAGESL